MGILGIHISVSITNYLGFTYSFTQYGGNSYRKEVINDISR